MSIDDDDALRRTLPRGGTFDHWPAPDGWRLRVGVWPGATRGTLLFLNGRGDFVEKYAEALHHWRARGWALIAPDWRGQGGSGRWVPGRDAFAVLTADLRAVVARAAQGYAEPLVAVGHSMGGHLLLRALAEGAPAIARAVLTAPMLGLRAAGLVRAAAWGACGLGLGGRAAPGQSPRTSAQAATRAALLTSDTARQADEGWWLAHHPELASPGVTWGWLDAALRSIALLGEDSRIGGTAHVAAVLAGRDRVVDTAAAVALLTRRFGSDAVLGTLPGEHELLRETPAIQAQAYALIDPFLEQA